MGSIKLEQPSQDLMAFQRIAELVSAETTMTLRSVSKSLGVSTTGVRACLDRLESHFGCVLVSVRQRSHEGMLLTPSGEKLLEQIRTLHNCRLLRQQSELRVHVSHSLLTSQLLGPILSDILRQEDSSPALAPRVKLDFGHVIESFRLGDLDLAIIYGFPRRLTNLPSDMNCVEVGPKIPTAVVAKSTDVLAAITDESGRIDPHAISSMRFACVDENRQPIPSEIPPDWPTRVACMEVSNFDTAIGLVRAGIADFTIVPSICGGIAHDRVCGTLAWSEHPELALDVCLVTSVSGLRGQSRSHELASFVDTVRRRLGDVILGRSSWPRGSASFSLLPEWYEELQYAYYLETDDDQQAGTKWFSERVVLRSVAAPIEGTAGFEGTIVNCRGAVFSIESARQLDELFYVVAKKQNNERSSVASFVSIFNKCHDDDGVICGLWTGKNRLGYRVLNSTIWSKCELRPRDLRGLADDVSWAINSNSELCCASFGEEVDVPVDQKTR